MLPNLSFALIHSLTKCILEDVLKEGYTENFVIFAEKYPWWNLMWRKLQYVWYQFIYLFIYSCIYLVILKEVFRQINFLGIYDVLNTDNSSNLDY